MTVRVLWAVFILSLSQSIEAATPDDAYSLSAGRGCVGSGCVAADYSELRATPANAGLISNVTGTNIAGTFDWVAADPYGEGDNGGTVVAASGGGWWVRDLPEIIPDTWAQWFEYPDRLAGQQLTALNNQCPGVPTSFNTVHNVTTWAEFEAAHDNAQPGDAVVFEDRIWTDRKVQYSCPTPEFPNKTCFDFSWTKDGTEANPIYIMSETLHGADFAAPAARIHITMYGAHTRWIGLKGNWHFETYDDGIRMACNDFVGNGDGDPELPNDTDELMNIRPGAGFNNENFEFDNNIVRNYTTGIINQQCSGCQQNENTHVHHNDFLENTLGPCANGNGCEALFWGLSNAGVNNGRLLGIIENNLFDNWGQDNEILTNKSSANIFRNNCMINESTGMISSRGGYDNMYYGNWLAYTGGLGYMRNSTEEALWAFNYAAKSPTDSDARLFTIYPEYNGQEYQSSTNSQFMYNVFSSTGNYFAYLINLYYPSAFSGINYFTSNADVIGNVFYSTGGMGDYRDEQNAGESEASFKSKNTFGGNYNMNETLTPGQTRADCFNPDLFDGPGSEGETYVLPKNSTNPQQTPIFPPSWWDAGENLDEPYIIVSTTGDDATGDGSLANPYRNPEYATQQAVAGDTIYIRGGSYTDHDGDGGVIFMTGTASGTEGAPITLRNYPGETPIITGDSVYGLVHAENDDYWTIKGLTFQDTAYPEIFGVDQGTACVFLSGSSSKMEGWQILDNNFIRCARTAIDCTDGFGHSGIFTGGATSNLLVDGNYFESSGRNRDASCDSSETEANNHQYRHDHHVYLQGSGITVSNNEFWDAQSGFPVRYGGPLRSLFSEPAAGEFTHKIVNNTIGPKTNPEVYSTESGAPFRAFTNNPSTTEWNTRSYIANNVVLDQVNTPAMLAITTNYYTNEVGYTGSVCEGNVAVSNSGTAMQSPCSSHMPGFTAYITETSNLIGQSEASLNFVDAANKDVHITSGSVAEGAGIKSQDSPVLDRDKIQRGLPPDAGAYEAQ